MKYPPREGDLPRDELMKRAQIVVDESNGKTDVMFKFTCEHCGERCMFQKPNVLYENGECHKCGKSTKVEFGGFSLWTKFG